MWPRLRVWRIARTRPPEAAAISSATSPLPSGEASSTISTSAVTPACPSTESTHSAR
jgi:hypothetical protein